MPEPSVITSTGPGPLNDDNARRLEESRAAAIHAAAARDGLLRDRERESSFVNRWRYR
jgi:hypothetical protein